MGTIITAKDSYRISISENFNYGTAICPYMGGISKYNGNTDRWDLLYTNEYNFKFTAYLSLSRVLRKLKKMDKIHDKYLT